jgi:predicted permease
MIYNVFLISSRQETRGQWQIIFYIAAGIYATGALIFVVFARGTEQPWNKPNGKGLSFRNKNGDVPYSILDEPSGADVRNVNH